MRKIIKKVLTENYANLTSLPKMSLPKLPAEMFAVGLIMISSGVQRTATFDDIMEEFQARMNFKRSPAELQEYFVKFLTSLNKVGGSFAAASSLLQDEWTEAIRHNFTLDTAIIICHCKYNIDFYSFFVFTIIEPNIVILSNNYIVKLRDLN